MKKKILLLFGIFILGIIGKANAQFPHFPNNEPPILNDPIGEEDGPEPPPAAPINDYQSFLLVAGLSFGLFKVHKKIKSNQISCYIEK